MFAAEEEGLRGKVYLSILSRCFSLLLEQFLLMSLILTDLKHTHTYTHTHTHTELATKDRPAVLDRGKKKMRIPSLFVCM